VQAVPIPRALENKVEDGFIQEGRAIGIDFEQNAEEAMNLCAGGKCGYFKVELPDGRKMVHLIREHTPFNLQFGRYVMHIYRGMLPLILRCVFVCVQASACFTLGCPR
jgi:hypothetical protein